MEKTKEEKIVQQVTDYVNTFSLHPEKFIAAMEREHRTLQQSFTKLCMQWIEHVANEEYRTDGRNEASHDICKELLERFTENNHLVDPSRFLPMI